jgi:acetyl-CoA synthetase
LIPHRALIGNLPGFVCSQNWFGFDGKTNEETSAVFWSPADWAWTGGLMDALLPTLYFGRPIVAYNGRFSPELAFTLMQEHGVTHTFLFPTALKAMMKAYPEPAKLFKLRLQAMMSAGEAVGDAVFNYCRLQLGVTVNEMFGQTEINYVVGNCSMNGRTGGGIGWPARAGSMGRGYPGHRVAVIDEDGNECPVGVPGDVAVNRYDVHGDPTLSFFSGTGRTKTPPATSTPATGAAPATWPRATQTAISGTRAGPTTCSRRQGYRIGPSEIENCLVKHPAVINAAVVPKPDRERGALVKAFVVLAPDFAAARAQAGADFDAQLVAQLQAHVKGKLAPYEYPKEIEFIDALPMTTTGKVQRRVLRLQEEEKAKGK